MTLDVFISASVEWGCQLQPQSIGWVWVINKACEAVGTELGTQ